AAIFKTLHRINAEHRLSELRMELVKDRLTQPGGCVFNHTRNHTPYGIPIETHLVDQFDHLRSSLLMRASDHVFICARKVKGLVWRRDDVAHARDISVNGDAQGPPVELRNGTGRDPGCRFPRGTSPTPAVITDPVL